MKRFLTMIALVAVVAAGGMTGVYAAERFNGADGEKAVMRHGHGGHGGWGRRGGGGGGCWGGGRSDGDRNDGWRCSGGNYHYGQDNGGYGCH